jgi:hypothetical protein
MPYHYGLDRLEFSVLPNCVPQRAYTDFAQKPRKIHKMDLGLHQPSRRKLEKTND